MAKRFRLTGWAKFPGGLIVRDEDVYQLIIKHSRLIDRLNPRKWVEMTFWAFDILSKSVETPSNPNWKFYGKNRRYMDILRGEAY